MRSSATSRLIAFPGSKWADFLLLACLMSYTIGFLAVHKATNACFLLIFLLAMAHRLRCWRDYRALTYGRAGVWLMCALVSPFIVVVFTRLLRRELDYHDLDAEARYLVAALLFGYFMIKRINLSRILEITLPLALLATLIAALSIPAAVTKHWQGRAATSFVDPNVLGSYSAILTFMTLMILDSSRRASFVLHILKIAGIGAGLYLTLLAASRGGWLAMPPMLLLWVFFRWRGHADDKKKILYSALLLSTIIIGSILLMPGLKARAEAPAGDVASWMDGSNKVTAPGQRLSIWKLSLHLIAEKPLTGWGVAGSTARIASPEFVAQWADEVVFSPSSGYGGAHNDALQMMIVSGVWGLLAYALLIFVPLGFFLWQHARAKDDARLACELGACLVLGVMVCGLTNEMLSLKYLASFYSLSVSGLAAQAVVHRTSTLASK